MSLVIKDTSLCGLGQTSPNPVLSMLDNFYDEYVAHVTIRNVRPVNAASLMEYVIILKIVSDVQHAQGFAR